MASRSGKRNKQTVKLAGGTVGPINIMLTKGFSVSGILHDENNRPKQGIEVYIAYRDGHYNRYYRPTTKTDAEGRFKLTNVRPGEAWVSTEVKLNKDENNKPIPFKAVTEVDIEDTDIDGIILRSRISIKKLVCGVTLNRRISSIAHGESHFTHNCIGLNRI